MSTMEHDFPCKSVKGNKLSFNKRKECCQFIANASNLCHKKCATHRQKKDSRMHFANIDDDYELIKTLCCLKKGHARSEVRDTRSCAVNMLRQLQHPDLALSSDDSLSNGVYVCHTLKCAARKAYKKKFEVEKVNAEVEVFYDSPDKEEEVEEEVFYDSSEEITPSFDVFHVVEDEMTASDAVHTEMSAADADGTIHATKRRRRSLFEILDEKIGASNRRKPHHLLSTSRQQTLVSDMAFEVMAHANPRAKSIDDINKNKIFFKLCLDLLDDVRADLMKKIEVDPIELEAMIVEEEHGESTTEESEDEQIKKIDELSGCLLTAVGNKLFDFVKSQLNDIFSVKMKSRCILDKDEDGVLVEEVHLPPDPDEPKLLETRTTTVTVSTSKNADGTVSTDTQTNTQTKSFNNAADDYDVVGDDVDRGHASMLKNSGKGARIPLRCAMKKCVEDASKSGIDYKSGTENIAVIECADGANHDVTSRTEASVITGSITMLSNVSVNQKKKFSSNPTNVFTAFQAQAKENFHNATYLLGPLCDEMRCDKTLDGIVDDPSKVDYWHMHDGKMLYLLLQHSTYCRKYHPFLSCKCARGDAVRNEQSHTCEMMTNKDYAFYQDRSLQSYEVRNRSVSSYTKAMHRDWCDKYNFGITHYGLAHDKLLVENILYDVFHMRSAVTRKLLHYFRNLLDLQADYDTKKIFFDCFDKLWGSNYFSSQFVINTTLTRLQGRHVLLWIRDIHAFVSLVENRIVPAPEMKAFLKACQVWKHMTSFLNITVVEDKSRYEQDLKQFIADGEEFYALGSVSFLTVDSVGDGETFYTHALRCYLPKIAQKLLDKYGVGLGVCTMQGFEHKNKQSKRMFRNKSNGKGNVCVQSIKSLCQLFK